MEINKMIVCHDPHNSQSIADVEKEHEFVTDFSKIIFEFLKPKYGVFNSVFLRNDLVKVIPKSMCLDFGGNSEKPSIAKIINAANDKYDLVVFLTIQPHTVEKPDKFKKAWSLFKIFLKSLK